MIKYTIVCPNCGETKTFEKKRPCNYEKRFCSRNCAASKTNTDKIEYTIVCPNCGKSKTFEKKFPSSDEKKFCGRSCAASYSSKRLWANPNYRAKQTKKKVYTITCLNCGKENTFEGYPHRGKRQFCDRSCAATYGNLKTWANPKVRARRIKGITEQHNTEEYKRNAQASWTEERRAGASQRAKDTYFEKVGRPGAAEKMRETKRDEEHRELARQQAFERWNNPEFKAQRIKDMQELAQSEEHRAILSAAAFASWEDNPERREGQSQRAKALWEDPDWARRQLQNMMTGWRSRPTNPELALFALLNSNDYHYVYIGDGGLWIGTKNPDFIWPEQRKLIEMNGSYWHSEDEVEPRINYFANYDFETLIVWDYELDNTEQLLTKLDKFHQGAKLIE